MAPPPGATAESYIEPFNTAFDEIRDGVDSAVESFNTLVERVQDWKWILAASGPGAWWIIDNLDNIRDNLDNIIDKIEYALEHQTPVVSLIYSSFSWIDSVQTPVSNMSSATVGYASDNLFNWSGPAADAYNSKAGGQQGAVNEAAGKAEFISGWLFNIAQANVDFATELAGIMADVAGKLTQAVIEGATVIDIPWAISTAAELVGTLVTEGLNVLIGIAGRFTEALGNVRDLASDVGDYAKLPGGNWPEAVRG